MSTLETLRWSQKYKIKEIFNKITSSSLYKEYKNKLGLSNYTIMIATEPYQQQITEMTSYAYSSSVKKFPLTTILQVPLTEIYKMFAPKVKHLIKCGTLIIAIDEDNTVCGTTAWFDLCDAKWDHLQVEMQNDATEAIHYLFESLCEKYCKKDVEFGKVYNDQVKENELHLYYGKWKEGTFYAKKPNVKNNAIMALLSAVSGWVAREVGYNYSISRSITPQVYRHYINAKYYYLDTTQKLKDISTFEKIFHELQYKHGYDKQYIDRLRELQTYFVIQKYEKRLKIGEMFFKERVERYFKQYRSRSKI
eukprot:221942_1